MRGRERIASVNRSTPAMGAALPALPMPETTLVRLLRIAADCMGAYFEPHFTAMGLTENSFHVLCLLLAAPKGQASPSELADMVGTSRANMTRILEQLTKAGLIMRAIETRDARRQAIALTEAGHRLATATSEGISAPLTRAFGGLSAEERVMLDQLLRKTIISFDDGALQLDAIA
jgi:MarR family transcriptional regulator, negative regulator of the multidrug operon emrRAB